MEHSIVIISLLYGSILYLRNKCYDWKIFKSIQFNIPIIVVGNLTLGGTGKTPHIEYLIRLLENNHKIATLSRGYKRKSKGFLLSNESSTINDIGDAADDDGAKGDAKGDPTIAYGTFAVGFRF